MTAGIEWPQLPEGVEYTEIGRQEYILFRDGTETFAAWEPGGDGEMELAEVMVSPGPHP